MNTIILEPTDVLFFRDGRPMEGSLAGHGAGWPTPNVISAALHAALHRSGFVGHPHRRGARGVYASDAQRDRKYGSLTVAGPFPVKAGNKGETWFFPRPLDIQNASLDPALLPTDAFDPIDSSLPEPLAYAVANLQPPNKDSLAKAWLSKTAYENYLKEANSIENESVKDEDFADQEQNIGIGIDPATGTTGQGEAEGKLYSAHYLRLRDDWRMGLLAETHDKDFKPHSGDMVKALFDGQDKHRIIVGGQQRVCTASLQTCKIQLPAGKRSGFNRNQHGTKYLVKWILLSPAVWPDIPAQSKEGASLKPHTGGWLPNWVDQQTGAVLLKSGNTERQNGETRISWRERVRGFHSIAAQLVAAIVPKPIIVTGYALPNDAADAPNGGAKSTHLAVPAGAVYYFEADSEAEAQNLADALNWHGNDPDSTTVRNRRSTLLGEKGFGLGVCGTWHFWGATKANP